VAPVVTIPWLAVLLTIPGALVLVNVTALLPARAAARTLPGVALRSERSHLRKAVRSSRALQPLEFPPHCRRRGRGIAFTVATSVLPPVRPVAVDVPRRVARSVRDASDDGVGRAIVVPVRAVANGRQRS